MDLNSSWHQPAPIPDTTTSLSVGNAIFSACCEAARADEQPIYDATGGSTRAREPKDCFQSNQRRVFRLTRGALTCASVGRASRLQAQLASQQLEADRQQERHDWLGPPRRCQCAFCASIPRNRSCSSQARRVGLYRKFE